MNTLKISLLIFITVCLTFSCSSDDSPAKIDSKLIIGTWKWTESSKDGSAVTLTACNLLNTLHFTNTQATYTSHYKGTTTACTSSSSTNTYSISDNTITETSKSKEIVTLNSTTLVLKFEETSNNETSVYINTYTK